MFNRPTLTTNEKSIEIPRKGYASLSQRLQKKEKATLKIMNIKLRLQHVHVNYIKVIIDNSDAPTHQT